MWLDLVKENFWEPEGKRKEENHRLRWSQDVRKEKAWSEDTEAKFQ
jgi:hypothetical protein